MMLNRRHFIAATAALPTLSLRWAKAAAPVDRALIVVFLRGGMDAVNLLAPADDKFYEASRPKELRISTSGADKGLNLGGMLQAFGGDTDLLLNPAAKSLHTLWRKKQLALIPAAGLHNATRSHFQAMDLIERGVSTDAMSLPREGWLTRLVTSLGASAPGSTLCLGGAMPQSLSLCETALPVSDLWDIDWMPSGPFREVLLKFHQGDSDLDKASRQAISATGFLAEKLERNNDHQPVMRDLPKGIHYPDHDFGNKLRFLAEMMRISPNIQLATADLDGWDTHDNQKDRFAQLVHTLSESMLAFHDHLDAMGRPTTIVVMSEFGRRIKANDNGGTDHGHGGVMMVLGDQVAGGQNFGSWPGLATEQLDQGMDLAVTTDFRSVLASVLKNQGAQSSVASVFPQFDAQIVPGLFKA